MRASRVTQEATQDLTLETLARSQRFWWDHWQKMIDLGFAFALPATDRRLNERLEAAERAATKRQSDLWAQIEQTTGELGESVRGQAQAAREAAREQRATREAFQAAVEELSGRIQKLERAQAKQLEALDATLAEHEQRLRERLGDRIRGAVGSIEAASRSDLEPLRQQLNELAEAVAAMRRELAALGHDVRSDAKGNGSSRSSGGSASTKEEAGSGGKKEG